MKYSVLSLVFLFSVVGYSRPCEISLDSIIKYADWCDNVETIKFHEGNVYVKSLSDQYAYEVNAYIPETNKQLFLIRGRRTKEWDAREYTLVGWIERDSVFFHQFIGRCFLTYTKKNGSSYTPAGGLKVIAYPLTSFTYKSPMQDLTKEEKEANQTFLKPNQHQQISLVKQGGLYFNDSIQVMIDSFATFTRITIHHHTVNQQMTILPKHFSTMILQSVGIKVEHVVDNAQRATLRNPRQVNNSYRYTYQNQYYSLIIYTESSYPHGAIYELEVFK